MEAETSVPSATAGSNASQESQPPARKDVFWNNLHQYRESSARASMGGTYSNEQLLEGRANLGQAMGWRENRFMTFQEQNERVIKILENSENGYKIEKPQDIIPFIEKDSRALGAMAKEYFKDPNSEAAYRLQTGTSDHLLLSRAYDHLLSISPLDEKVKGLFTDYRKNLTHEKHLLAEISVTNDKARLKDLEGEFRRVTRERNRLTGKLEPYLPKEKEKAIVTRAGQTLEKVRMFQEVEKPKDLLGLMDSLGDRLLTDSNEYLKTNMTHQTLASSRIADEALLSNDLVAAYDYSIDQAEDLTEAQRNAYENYGQAYSDLVDFISTSTLDIAGSRKYQKDLRTAKRREADARIDLSAALNDGKPPREVDWEEKVGIELKPERKYSWERPGGLYYELVEQRFQSEEKDPIYRLYYLDDRGDVVVEEKVNKEGLRTSETKKTVIDQVESEEVADMIGNSERIISTELKPYLDNAYTVESNIPLPTIAEADTNNLVINNTTEELDIPLSDRNTKAGYNIEAGWKREGARYYHRFRSNFQDGKPAQDYLTYWDGKNVWLEEVAEDGGKLQPAILLGENVEDEGIAEDKVNDYINKFFVERAYTLGRDLPLSEESSSDNPVEVKEDKLKETNEFILDALLASESLGGMRNFTTFVSEQFESAKERYAQFPSDQMKENLTSLSDKYFAVLRLKNLCLDQELSRAPLRLHGTGQEITEIINMWKFTSDTVGKIEKIKQMEQLIAQKEEARVRI